MSYQSKYLKYKNKYLSLKNILEKQMGGDNESPEEAVADAARHLRDAINSADSAARTVNAIFLERDNANVGPAIVNIISIAAHDASFESTNAGNAVNDARNAVSRAQAAARANNAIAARLAANEAAAAAHVAEASASRAAAALAYATGAIAGASARVSIGQDYPPAPQLSLSRSNAYPPILSLSRSNAYDDRDFLQVAPAAYARAPPVVPVDMNIYKDIKWEIKDNSDLGNIFNNDRHDLLPPARAIEAAQEAQRAAARAPPPAPRQGPPQEPPEPILEIRT